MAFSYSKYLVDQIIDYFRSAYNTVLTPEQANEYLDSYVGLFLAFADDYERKGEAILGVSGGHPVKPPAVPI